MEIGGLHILDNIVPFFVRSIYHLGTSLWYPFLIFSGIFFVELVSGASWRRYYSRNFLIDVFHYVFYVGGFFTFLIYNPVFSVLKPVLSIFEFGILINMPSLLAYVLYFVYLDFVSYWFHRWLHTNRLMWTLHSVHHSPTQLTGVTTLRRHIGEIVIASVFTYVAVLLPLGKVTTSVWPVITLVWVVRVLESVHHAELNWRLRPLYRVVVSPVFHAIHHSTDAAHHHKNFSIIFSFWDYLFGTAAESESRPQQYGVQDMHLDNSFTGQVVVPFKNLLQTLRIQRGPHQSRL